MEESWVWFGTGKTQRYIPLHKLLCCIRPKNTSLPLFHAITGYNQVSSSANKSTKELFSKKGRLLDGIPPTTDTLQLHIYRAIYQASYCWAQSLCKIPSLADPCEWGWKMEDKHYKIVWTSIPEASKMCNELI